MGTSAEEATSRCSDPLGDVVRRVWGYETFRPLQRETMEAAVAARDALVVLPTGGGKSLCYQAPALLTERPTVIVSPLIALMKDQVDALRQRGVEAACLHSGLTVEERRETFRALNQRRLRMLFVAPERCRSERFVEMLGQAGVGAFAVDEAHCISQWGHDFRGDYRKLDQLKQWCPDACVHAFTATATPPVRRDIISQLGLVDPLVLVGDFFRPNLRYSVRKRAFEFDDVLDEIRSRPGQAGIVYCIRRRDVDDLAAYLQTLKINAAAYHAGLSDEERSTAQEAFAAGEVDVIVATVAFGMGIDRGDIRYVIHAAMPQSLEHYQQESGRAGRDGKPADCILFYSDRDFFVWKKVMGRDSGEQAHHRKESLERVYNYCRETSCRHRRLVEHFGQTWRRVTCRSCDNCEALGDPLADSTVLAQKVMSAIVRTGEKFGAGYVAQVLRGEETDAVRAREHTDLSTFGLLREASVDNIRGWVKQLCTQGLVERHGAHSALRVTNAGWAVLRSQLEAELFSADSLQRAEAEKTVVYDVDASVGALATRSKRKSKGRKTRKGGGSRRSAAVADSISGGEDSGKAALFEDLRAWRASVATERSIPAYVVFPDRTLRALADIVPASEDDLRGVPGIGPKKLAQYGDAVLEVCRRHG